ncbi:serine protease [Stagnimonas aquatica]|uniref:Serine protease n=1 Tax=Stagnimonas aquatica TaxID=2689987 RepID=A0A3N0V8T8_9GAMM|nr:serine protease [Stagnimonas aquatica]ROH89024.1 serine protease [Stagnimonas aquatica]
MNYQTRQQIYRRIERARSSKVLAFVTGDRPQLETQIAPDCIPLFVDLLDQIGPTKKISLILHTNGGHTSAAWRLINLIRTFCDELEVLIPLKALSSGTLISIGADKIIMTKQAALGPIDPSLVHALSPTVPGPFPGQVQRVPASVEAVRGYLDHATQDLKITDEAARASLLIDLSNKIHPLVLGEIFRSRQQIRYLAKKLLSPQIRDAKKVDKIIDFLCADSGSHDYTINRREAHELGLPTGKPSESFYRLLRDVNASYTAELQLLEPLSVDVVLGVAQQVQYTHVRGLVESCDGGSYRFLTEGTYTRLPQPPDAINDRKSFEGWRKI